jgi:hypothetical protein
MHLVNSLLVEVANPGYYDSAVSVGIESNGAGVFEPVGAGGHYLQVGSPHRNVGTNSIDTGLAARLKRLTTYAPVVLTGSITQDTVLEPQAWRDVDGPDRGFHYEPLDYAVNALQLQNATLTLTNGVALVTHSHNAYASTAGRIGVPQTGDQTLSSVAYYSRDLGRYYQHLASSLRNAGSRQATAAGLARYTTTWDYAKDTGLVDIGLHYVATANGLPIDTDGDGLPDYVEDANGNLQVDPGETDWTDPDTGGTGISDAAKAAGLTPQTPCLLYSLHHPHQVGVWSQGQDLQRNSQVLLVERGTDALRIRVYVQTTQTPPSWYADFNDELTYRIESPLLEEAISGSYHIAQLGQAWWIDVVPETWMVCHDKTRETGSYLKVTVTSRNVNCTPPDAASQIVVFLSALRIDFSPILGPAADDRLVFDNQYPTGVLSVPLYAAVRPNEQPAFDYLEGRVKFEVDAVGDSELKWENENGGLGIHDPSSGAFRNLAEFRMLPTSNSAFGPKIARLSVDDLWGLESEQSFRVFFPADEYNYPGCPPVSDPEIDRFVPPNYFFYYSQIPSVVYGNPQFHYLGSKAPKPWMNDPPYPYYVEARKFRLGYPVHFGKNAGKTYQYINVFAYACRHEATHGSNYAVWWPQKHRGMAEDDDVDRPWPDAIPNQVEIAHGYNPHHPRTYTCPPEININDWDDDQHFTLTTEPEWEPNDGDGLDWAHPGAQWP